MQYDLKIEEVSISQRKLHFAIHANEVKKESSSHEQIDDMSLATILKEHSPRPLVKRKRKKESAHDFPAID